MEKIRVTIVDDHQLMLAGLRMLINAQLDMEVVAEARTAQSALALTDLHPSDVMLLDLTMPGGGSMELIEILAARRGAPRVLVLTMHENPAYARAALGAGAAGYVVKNVDVESLLAAIRTVQRGQAIVNLGDEQRTVQVFGANEGRNVQQVRRGFKLSDREMEVLQLLGKGYTNRGVADHLDLSPKTVATYRARIAEKYGLKTTVDFVKYVSDTGLLGIDDRPR